MDIRDWVWLLVCIYLLHVLYRMRTLQFNYLSKIAGIFVQNAIWIKIFSSKENVGHYPNIWDSSSSCTTPASQKDYTTQPKRILWNVKTRRLYYGQDLRNDKLILNEALYMFCALYFPPPLYSNLPETNGSFTSFCRIPSQLT